MGDESTVKQEQAPAAVGTPVTDPGAAAAKNDIPTTKPAEEDVSDSILSEFFLFLKEEKKWWLAPLILVLVALGGIIIFAEGSAIAPFIYTIF